MFWKNKDKQKQISIVREIQMEDDVFHRVITALERLETYLYGKKSIELKQTAIGDGKDHHKENVVSQDEEYYFLELKLQCQALSLNAKYDDKEIFTNAVKMFTENILEWYAGRKELDFYDKVDACIVPIMGAISNGSSDVFGDFDKYVSKVRDMNDLSLEEKHQSIMEGIRGIISGEHELINELEKKGNGDDNDEIITRHYRGDVLDGYKRIVLALSSLYVDSAPLKLFYKLMKEYLPEVVGKMPNINLESIDNYFQKGDEPTPNIPFEKMDDSVSIHASKDINIEDTLQAKDLNERLETIVKGILDVANIQHKGVKIEILY